jgi:serine/threonine protein kinase
MLSDSGYIDIENFSSDWSDITLLQQRRQNTIYTAKRYGKRYLLKAISPEYQSLTDIRLLQEKEFSLGILLNHSNIAETYSLEEVPEIGRCIVMEYVDGMTLAQWLNSSPTRAQRERVLAQLLEVMEYIHGLQLVHNDLKSSNILITRNGQNVKLIDFGLSDTDSTSETNNASTDIQLFASILTLLFPKRYRPIARACQRGQYANIAALKQAFHRRHIWRKSLPYIVSLICVVVCSIVLLRSRTQQLREQAMLDIVNHHVEIKINELQCSADTFTTYLEFSQKHYGIIWKETAIIRDSIANLYADDPVLRQKCLQTWTSLFGERFIQFDTQVKQSKSQP